MNITLDKTAAEAAGFSVWLELNGYTVIWDQYSAVDGVRTSYRRILSIMICGIDTVRRVKP